MLTHKPTGMTVRVENGRSQLQNLQTAKQMVAARIRKEQAETAKGATDATRKEMLGVGARGDKRRSVALQQDQVVDHTLDLRMTASQYLKGDLSPFYD